MADKNYTRVERGGDLEEKEDLPEPHAPKSGTPPRGLQDEGMLSENTYVNMNAIKQKLWIMTNGTTPVMLKKKAIHLHGLMAAERNVLEEIAWRLAKRDRDSFCPRASVVAVAANPAREEHYADPSLDWFMIPLCHSDDLRRRRQVSASFSGRVCEHKVGECCHPNLTPATAIFVHSAYYVDYEVLWDFVSTMAIGYIYVVGHCFDEAMGAFYDEAKYQYSGKKVSTWVVGNQLPYVHEPLPWTIGKASETGKQFEACIVEKRGTTFLWRVSAVMKNPGPLPTLKWDEVCTSEFHVGPVQFSAAAKSRISDNARTKEIAIDFDHVWRFGPIIMSESLRGSFVLPVNAISELQLYVVGRPRTPAVLNDVIRRSSELFKTARVPQMDRANAAMVAALLAFCGSVEFEVDMLQTASSTYSTWFNMHIGLLQLVPLNPHRVCAFLLIMLLLVSLGLVVIFEEPDKQHIAGSVLLGLAGIITITYFCVRQASKIYHARLFDNWRSGVIAHEATSIPSTYVDNVTFPGSQLVKPIGPIDIRKAEIKLEEEPIRKHEEPLTTRLLASGIVFDTVVPTNIEATQESELSAISHRFAMSTNAFRSDIVDKWINAAMKMQEFVGFGKKLISEGEGAFYQWVTNIPFNAHYKEEMIRLHKETMESRPGDRNAKVFQKDEKTTKPVTRDPYQRPKPRLIQAPSDDLKARLGYIVAQMYAMTCNLWNGKDSRILYCSGLTPDVIGQRIDEFLLRYPDAEAIENDFSSYDATVGYQLTHRVYDLYQKLGCSKSTMEWFDCTQSAGRTPHGVRFKILPQKGETRYDGTESTTKKIIFSGEPDTNLKGTIVNVICFLAAILYCLYNGLFRNFNPKLSGNTLPFLMLVCGDDNITLVPRGMVDEKSLEEIKQFLVNCGLTPNVILRKKRSEWTFCSKLFWYGRDPKTGSVHTVLGGMPGRVLYRHGWSTTHAGSMNIAASTTGARIDNNHVPLLASYMQKTYEMCRDQRIRPNKEEFSNFKHCTRMYDDCEENRALFNDRYTIDFDNCQRTLDEAMSEVSKIPSTIHWEAIEMLVAKDVETERMSEWF